MRISPDSPLAQSPYLIAVSVDAGSAAEGFIHIASPVTEEVLRAEFGSRIEASRRIEWDRSGNRIRGFLEERIGALLLASEQFSPDDDEAFPLLCEAVRTSPGMLTLGPEEKQFLGRLRAVRSAFPEEQWPDLSEQTLTLKPESWLRPWLGSIRSRRELENIHLLAALKTLLSREQLRLLEERTPAAVTVPSGSRIRIDYADGDTPVLAVKLQELFGLAETPRIGGGRIVLLLHLLSPARRPVQITRDLRGFWSNGYPQVKKDLKGRYPRHPWPEDPWNALPTKRTNPRNN